MPRAEYRLADGSLAPGVTTVLDCLGFKGEGLMRWAHQLGRDGLSLDDARRRPRDAGTYGHALVTERLRRYCDETTIFGAIDEPDDSALDPEERDGGREMLEAFLRWEAQAEIAHVIALEANIISEVFRCGGTPDVVFRRRSGRVVLADWKGTKGGRLYVEHPLQLAAYGMLWSSWMPHIQIDEHEVVLLSREGKKHKPRRPWTQQELEPHRAAFLSALTIHRLRPALEQSIKRRAA